MKKALSVLLLVAGVVILIFSFIMTVMAVRFMEWGRVLFYGFFTLLALELIILIILNLKKKS